jgi:hypothetical protein
MSRNIPIEVQYWIEDQKRFRKMQLWIGRLTFFLELICYISFGAIAIFFVAVILHGA